MYISPPCALGWTVQECLCRRLACVRCGASRCHILCVSVSVFVGTYPPCALWLTVQRYARRQRAAVCLCLCAYVLTQAVYVYSPRRPPRGTLHGSILFATTRRQCQPCATYRAKCSGGSVCILLAFIFCFPRRAPGG